MKDELAEVFHEMIADQRAEGKAPIVEVGWGEMAHRFGDENAILRFGRKNNLAFALIVTRTFRRCFVMEPA